ncbi:unnamed protein product [Prorocentrum cordatum]|uniref:GINS subunit domain-containing protein n=1 Tax=Prorocentrum cordatum TaxID=2364126 RepID=A0ABN9U046_9DINO|nr:unnamed protein product [Polarella glacialis]
MAIRGGQNGSALFINSKTTSKLLGDDNFLALEEQVTVIPRFTSDDPVETIKGEFGPFRAHSVVRVPLWAALAMDKQNKCTIEMPLWMQEEEMKRLRDAEKQSNVLEKVHDHYIEIALALLSQSKTSDAGKREKARIRYLLREIVELRRNKIVEAMKTEIEAHQEALNVTGMSAAERIVKKRWTNRRSAPASAPAPCTSWTTSSASWPGRRWPTWRAIPSPRTRCRRRTA